MLQEERYQRITSLLALFKRVNTDQIIRELQVSRETVRRDLLALEALGQLRRVHGGVVRAHETPVEPPLSERMLAHHREKRAIARQAARLAAPGQTIFLDTGSTTLALADELFALAGLTLITNSIDIAARFAALDPSLQARNRLVMVEGTVAVGMPAICGEAAIAAIGRYRADMAMLSPVALNAEAGATSYDHQEAAVARAMCDCARGIVILADYSKIGQSSRVSYCPCSHVDTLVTDAQAEQLPALQAIARCGPTVIAAPAAG